MFRHTNDRRRKTSICLTGYPKEEIKGWSIGIIWRHNGYVFFLNDKNHKLRNPAHRVSATNEFINKMNIQTYQWNYTTGGGGGDRQKERYLREKEWSKNDGSLLAFSTVTMEAGRQWNDAFKVIRKKSSQPGTGCREKWPLRKGMDIKILTEKKHFTTQRLALKEHIQDGGSSFKIGSDYSDVCILFVSI